MILWFISFFESVVGLFSDASFSTSVFKFGYKILADFESVVIVSLIIFPFHYLTSYLKMPLVQMMINIVFAVLVILQFTLAKYHFTSVVNFGADLIGFPPKNLFAGASDNISVFYLIPFAFLPIFYTSVEDYLSKIAVGKK
ncbi:hypothetical protein FFWV33_18420 [Flavobacterium faecale]|uniref:Uncharacterized protein n=2 Tax=Flavobacterium faecale TaxID=1355330 RepID=A0A2S1LHY3_9FLAO|nr:hypothetical protein FFWV33_18420 [Flavobacterium faecale]